MEAYPHSLLPGPVFDGHSYQQVDPVARTNVESGSFKARRRFTKTPTKWKVKFRFISDYEFQVFEAWHRHKLNDGASLFTANITVSTGPSVAHTCAFAAMYRHTNDERIWTVSADLLIFDRATQSEAWLDAELA